MRSSSLAKRTMDTPEGSGVRGTLHTRRRGRGGGGEGRGGAGERRGGGGGGERRG